MPPVGVFLLKANGSKSKSAVLVKDSAHHELVGQGTAGLGRETLRSLVVQRRARKALMHDLALLKVKCCGFWPF